MEIIEQYGGEFGASATGIEEPRKEVAYKNYEVTVKDLMRTKYLAAELLLEA